MRRVLLATLLSTALLLAACSDDTTGPET